MKTTIIIPSRMASQRLPRKALVPLTGCDGGQKTLIERCVEAARAVNVDTLVVATDHADIYDHVVNFGGQAAMTPVSCENGTARCAALADQVDADVIVNFQGDSPLIPVDFVDALIAYMRDHPEVDVATPVMTCTREMLDALREDRKAGRVGGTTAAFANSGRALYFSKEVLPISDAIEDPSQVYLHIGLYAYRKSALAQYTSWPEGRLEAIEKLEQLRFLENGMRVDCVKVDAKGRGFWEVNLPEDVARVEAALMARGIA